MTPARVAVVLLLATAAIIATVMAVRGTPGSATASSARHHIEIRAFRFEPTVVGVAPGDSVVWTNRDMVPHTVTATGGDWDSGSIAPGASWVLVVPPEGGDDYLCAFHPTMGGTIAVH